MDGFLQQLLERGHQRGVSRRCPLKDNVIPQRALVNYFGHVVVAHRIKHCRGERFFVPSLAQEHAQIPLHIYGASVAGIGRPGPESKIGKLKQGDVQSLGLFFDKAPGPGRTDVVHGREVDLSSPDQGKFGVLSADFNDRIDFGVEKYRCPGVGGDFIDLKIGFKELFDHFSS